MPDIWMLDGWMDRWTLLIIEMSCTSYRMSNWRLQLVNNYRCNIITNVGSETRNAQYKLGDDNCLNKGEIKLIYEVNFKASLSSYRIIEHD